MNDIKTTMEYFGMSAEKLNEQRDDYTLEECLLLEAADHIAFTCSTNTDDAWAESIWLISHEDYRRTVILEMTSGEYVVLAWYYE